MQEKEAEMAAISTQRTRFVDEQVDRLQEEERRAQEEAANAKKQLKQLTKDFQYNLQLLNDRDMELELLENQISTHKEAEAKRALVRTCRLSSSAAVLRSPVIQADSLETTARDLQEIAQVKEESNDLRAQLNRAAEDAEAARLAHQSKDEEHEAALRSAHAELDDASASLQQQIATCADVRFRGQHASQSHAHGLTRRRLIALSLGNVAAADR